MEDIEKYLKYVIHHKHLKKNSAFGLFLSDVSIVSIFILNTNYYMFKLTNSNLNIIGLG